MDIIRHNFIASPQYTFGVLLPLEDAIATYPGFFDLWKAEADSVSRDASNAVSSWTGRQGHVLGQPNEAWRPRFTGDRIDLANGAGAASGLLTLSGSVGASASDLTIAMMIELASLTADNQFLWGDQSAPTIRLRYRPSGGAPVLFLDGTDITGSQGMRVGPDQRRIPVILRILGGTATLSGGSGAGDAIVGSTHHLDVFNIGASGGTSPSLAGAVSRLGIWRSAVTDAQQAKVLEWLNAAP